MVEVSGDLWAHPAAYRVITTNGDVNRHGLAVMGRGCAKEAADRYPGLARDFGTTLRIFGNVVHRFEGLKLVTFPVKHHWHEKADLELIGRSAWQLRQLRLKGVVVIPRPGCGNGQLQWADVRPVLAAILLSERYHVITFGAP